MRLASLEKTIFVPSLSFFTFLYGVAADHFNWFPVPFLKLAWNQAYTSRSHPDYLEPQTHRPHGRSCSGARRRAGWADPDRVVVASRWQRRVPGASRDPHEGIRYWTAAYRYALDHAGPSTRLVSYARLTSDPDAALARLAEAAGIPAADLPPPGQAAAAATHASGRRVGNSFSRPDEALLLHERLEDQACV